MNPATSSARAVAASALALGLGLTLGACAAQPVTVQAPAREDVIGVANVMPGDEPSPPNSPSATNVSISDAVLAACHLPQADAFFPFDAAVDSEYDRSGLDALATCYTAGPMAGHSLRLVGHSDPRGAPDWLVTLGQARASAVQQYLVSHHVQARRIDATSRGALDATGNDEAGWAHDRRVDVLLGD